MAEISGTEGFVRVGGVAVEASEWRANLKQAVIDRTNFTTGGEPRNAAGQRTGTITMSGPRSTTTNLAALGITRGSLVTFVLGITASLGLTVVVRIADLDFSQNKDNGSDWSLSGEQYGAAAVTGL